MASIRLLHKLGVDVSVRDSSGVTPLLTAARHSTDEAIQVLAELGIDVNLADSHGVTPVQMAARGLKSYAFKVLHDLGADTGTSALGAENPIYFAVKADKLYLVEEFARCGADVNKPEGVYQKTAMFYAAERNDINAIHLLAKLGADVNKPNQYGRTPLFIAAQCHFDMAVKALLKLGADPNTPNNNGSTPMLVCVDYSIHRPETHRPETIREYCLSRPRRDDRINTIRALAKQGANVNTPNKKGHTPLSLAIQNDEINDDNVLRTLVEFGAKVNAPLRYGATTLHLAASKGYEEAMTTLLELGADINAPANNKSTPLLKAHESGQYMTAVWLVNQGADVKCFMSKTVAGSRGPIEDMIESFSEGTTFHTDDAKCNIYSMVKLLSLEVEFLGQHRSYDRFLQLLILQDGCQLGRLIYHNIPRSSIERISGVQHSVRKKVVILAWRIFEQSLLLDGDRISSDIKIKRFIELVCLFWDRDMLKDPYHLRLTCKSNNEQRRFPVCHSTYQELEVNLIESFLSYDAARFVPTTFFRKAIEMYAAA